MTSGFEVHNDVEPSTSVNKKVTVPDGNAPTLQVCQLPMARSADTFS
jgi:hypothetical protein